MPTRRNYSNALIANGASLSGVVDLGGYKLTGIVMPAAWTAATIGLQGSIDGTNFFPVVAASGTETALTVAASQLVLLGVIELPRYVKVRSGTQAVPVNQGADRAITLLFQE